MKNLVIRLQAIDTVTFFSETLPRIVQKHFEKFNLALAHQVDENHHIVRFMNARQLEDDRAEIEYIRKVCNYLLRILSPSNYTYSNEFIYLILEVLTNHVIFNIINHICDPYFINHFLTVHGSFIGPVDPPSRDSNFGTVYNTPGSGLNTPGFLIDDEDVTKEDISDSIYDLVCEVFVLKKAQHWLRRTIITLLQVAFGKTINKQLKDSILHLSSETFILDQLIKFRDAFWPEGVLAESNPEVSEHVRKLTYLLAKQYLINSIPDVFVNLIGPQNAKKGFLKVFEALQNKKANKQLFYVSFQSTCIQSSRKQFRLKTTLSLFLPFLSQMPTSRTFLMLLLSSYPPNSDPKRHKNNDDRFLVLDFSSVSD